MDCSILIPFHRFCLLSLVTSSLEKKIEAVICIDTVDARTCELNYSLLLIFFVCYLLLNGSSLKDRLEHSSLFLFYYFFQCHTSLSSAQSFFSIQFSSFVLICYSQWINLHLILSTCLRYTFTECSRNVWAFSIPVG